MKFTRVSCVAFCLALLVAVCATSLPKAHATGNPQPAETAFAKQFSAFYPMPAGRGMTPMNFIDAAGQGSTVEGHRGNLVLLHFWATWCAPCVKELPTLQALHEKRGQKQDGVGLVIVPVALDFNKNHAQIEKFMKKHGAGGLPALMIPAQDPSWDVLAGFPLPTSFLIGADGRVLYKMTGDGQWVSPESLTFIDHLLANQQK